MLDELNIEVGHAEAIVEKGIELGAYSDEMPSSKKDKIEAAHEIITFAIDSFVDDDVRPGVEGEDDEETESIAEAAEQILELFELAGIKAKKKGKKYTGDIEFGEPPEIEGGDDDDDEAPFAIDDIIEGYEELTPATRLKKIKALELDPDDDEDYNTLVSIAEWEEAQDKPSSRVLNYIDELIPPEDGDDETADEAGDAPEDEDDGDDDDVVDGEADSYTEKELLKLGKEELKKIWDEWELDPDEFPRRFTDKGKKERVVPAILAAQSGDAEDADEEGEFSEEPVEDWSDNDDKEKIAYVEEALEDDDEPLEAEELEYIIGWEKAQDKPRKRLISKLETIYSEAFEEADDDDDEPEEEEEEEKPKGRGRRSKAAKDDEEDEKSKSKKSSKSDSATVTLTRAQILEALESGEVEIEIG